MTPTPGWTDSHRRYLLTETTASVIVTIVLSCAFAWGVFGRSLPLASADPALQIDSALQALIVAFMGALVPTLLTRRRRCAGAVNGCGGTHRWPAHAVWRALTIALIVAVPAALLHVMIVPWAGIGFNLAGLLLLKSGFGTAIALIATPLAVSLALNSPVTESFFRDPGGCDVRCSRA